MSVKQSPGEVNIDQFNMVTGSITLSALSSFQLFYPSRLSHLISMSFLLAVLPMHSLGLCHSKYMFRFDGLIHTNEDL